jgi:hypothetical protein
MTTLSRADLNLLVESLSGEGALSAEQIRWLARLRFEAGHVDTAWLRLKQLAAEAQPTTSSLRELLERQYDR